MCSISNPATLAVLIFFFIVRNVYQLVSVSVFVSFASMSIYLFVSLSVLFPPSPHKLCLFLSLCLSASSVLLFPLLFFSFRLEDLFRSRRYTGYKLAYSALTNPPPCFLAVFTCPTTQQIGYGHRQTSVGPGGA